MSSMTQAKSQYARDARNLKPARYTGPTIPPRAGGLGSPLPTGTVVYPDGGARGQYVTVNLRRDGFGASFYLRASDLEVVS